MARWFGWQPYRRHREHTVLMRTQIDEQWREQGLFIGLDRWCARYRSLFVLGGRQLPAAAGHRPDSVARAVVVGRLRQTGVYTPNLGRKPSDVNKTGVAGGL